VILRTGAIHTPAPGHVPAFQDRVTISAMQASKSVDWHKAFPGEGDALGNDRAGACVEAWDMVEEAMRINNAMGANWRPTADLVLGRYSAETGYDPVTGTPDPGTDTAADTSLLCTKGVWVNPQLLDIPFWVTLDPTNPEHMRLAIEHCGPIAWTVNLPAAWQPLDWSVTPQNTADWVPGSWDSSGSAYHRIGSGKFDDDWFTARSWGLDLPVHPEALAIPGLLVAAELRISLRWLSATGLTPSGLSQDALMADRTRLMAA
jgi:hypothetical protein